MSEAEVVAQEGQVLASAVAPADNAEPSACTPGPAEVQPARSADVRPSPLISAARPEFLAAGVAPSDCGCGGGNGQECTCGTKTRQLVKAYVIGQVGYDFGTEARRDSFLQAMGKEVVDPQALLAYLKENPYEASRLTWTLLMESVPVYAIQAAGPYTDVANQRLVSFLENQRQGAADLCSIPGFIAGTTTLMAGQTVPVIVPVIRGMYNWTTTSLITAVLGAEPAAEAAEAEEERLRQDEEQPPEIPRPRLLRVQEHGSQAGRPGNQLCRDQPLPGPGSLRASASADPSAQVN